MKVVVETVQLLGSREALSGQTAEEADSAAARRKPSALPKPPADPDLDAAADDIPF